MNKINSIKFANTDLNLRYENNKYFLASKTDEIELTDTEASLSLRVSSEKFLDKLGTRSPFLDNSKSSALKEQIDCIRSNLPKDGFLVMLDTTTVENAFECLNGKITPLSLLDLGILTFALVCFDSIVLQPNSNLNSKIAKHTDLFSEIVYPDGFIQDTLWNLCSDIFDDDSISEPPSYKKFQEIWCDFLKMTPCDLKLDPKAWDSYQDSPYIWDGIFASHYYDFSHLTAETLEEFLSIQTARVLFNDRLASFLGIPYLCSSFRSGIYSELLSKKTEMRLLIDKLISQIGPEKLEIDQDSPYMSECSAPFLLGCILEKMNSPEDYWSILIDYRERFKPLRIKLWEDREMWDGKSTEYLKKFFKYLAESKINSINSIVESSAYVATSLTTASKLDVGLVGLGIKLLFLTNTTEKVYSYYLKHFKPEIFLLFDLNNESKRLMMIENKIKSIWGDEWTRQDHNELEFLSGYYPAEFLNLRKL